MRARGLLLLVLSVVVACGSDPASDCDREGVQAALDAAAPGSTVTLGACEVLGPLTVPAGVTLAGQAGSVVSAPEDGIAVVLSAGDAAAVVTGLAIRAEGRAGVAVRPGAAAEIREVQVDAARGVGIGAQGVTDLVMSGIEITGPITADNAADAMWLRTVAYPPPAGSCPAGTTCDCEPGSTEEGTGRVCDSSGHFAVVTATYGLYLEDSGATLTDVTIDGFAEFGAALLDSDVVWDGGSIENTLGVGLRQSGGSSSLTSVRVERTHQGVRGTAVYAIATTDDGVIAGADLTLSDNDRYGLVVLSGSADLSDVLATGNGDAAVWAGETRSFSLAGASMLSGNQFAGVVVADASGAVVNGATVEGTIESRRSVGGFEAIEVGDGLHVMGTSTGVEVLSSILRGNERAGAVFDLGADASGGGFSFTDVMVEAADAQLGAIAGARDAAGVLTPVAPGTWDTGITRAGAALSNDAAFADAIDVVASSAPGSVPSPAERVGVVVPMF